MVARGEVWWAESPVAGRRPYLVLSRDAAIPWLRQLLTAPLTRTVRGIPTEVPLDVDDGVSEPCAAWLDNVELMPKAYLVERMCTVGPQQMAAVCAALAIAVDCQR
ncbi:type II toxin-antitoxin system PemK/MazF family toxin [Iamia sp.]|uniref:type II toxin-antitoxin system PemK/MazF family toxin n=1 Tax=Iamia sp. TaxID=2722710 RepID=UPI002B9771C2|nr:type II toxin-antitoxin system PemK/MazF family toxin [Iamia sp.]HXH58243.1 type II toxin-antitoxin system PemK/MazF family toxin [Iamia sp.]